MSSFLETIKSNNGVIENLLYHQKRYESILESYGVLEYKNLKEYLNPPKSGVFRCRLVYTLDSIDVTYHSYERKNIESLKIVYSDIEYAQKSTNRDELNELYLKKESCDDILIVKDSLVTDTSIANIAIFLDGVWKTPKTPLLKGTTRDRLLEDGLLVEADIGVDELKESSKIALMNAMIGFYIVDNCRFLI